jgi:hypothetical protein
MFALDYKWHRDKEIFGRHEIQCSCWFLGKFGKGGILGSFVIMFFRQRLSLQRSRRKRNCGVFDRAEFSNLLVM